LKHIAHPLALTDRYQKRAPARTGPLLLPRERVTGPTGGNSSDGYPQDMIEPQVIIDHIVGYQAQMGQPMPYDNLADADGVNWTGTESELVALAEGIPGVIVYHPPSSDPLFGYEDPATIPDWPNALAPVTADEIRELRRFVSQVEKLVRCSLFNEHQDTLKISYEQGKPGLELVHSTEQEPVMAAATIFRQLYTPNEHGSASHASNILKKSAHERGGVEADKLVALMKRHEAGLREINRANGGFAINYNGTDLHFEQIIDLLVNAEVMHNDADKAAAFAQLEGFVWFQFVGALVNFRSRYWLMRNCVVAALTQLA
jgi:hypothetical protein